MRVVLCLAAITAALAMALVVGMNAPPAHAGFGEDLIAASGTLNNTNAVGGGVPDDEWEGGEPKVEPISPCEMGIGGDGCTVGKGGEGMPGIGDLIGPGGWFIYDSAEQQAEQAAVEAPAGDGVAPEVQDDTEC